MFQQESVEVAHLPLLGPEPVDGEPLMSVTRDQCDARPTAARHQRPLGGTKLYCLVTKAHVCVNNLPTVALDSVAAGIRTRDLLIASPALYRYATEPHVNVGVGNK